MKRLFCGLHVPGGMRIQEVVDDFQHVLKHDEVTWVHPGNMHLTLKFFGDTADEAIPGIVGALEAAAHDTAPFIFHVFGAGTFGQGREARVIWLGIANTEPMIALAENIHHALMRLGMHQEQRVFAPHLTIGRIRQLHHDRALHALLKKYRNTQFEEVQAKHLYLYESRLRPQGPLYSVISEIPLGSEQRA